MLSSRSWQCCCACWTSFSSSRLSPGVNMELSLLSDRKSANWDSRWSRTCCRSDGDWQRTWQVRRRGREGKYSGAEEDRSSAEGTGLKKPHRVQVPSRDSPDVFEQVVPGHHALHVDMQLMPQRHDLLVQLLCPVHTNRTGLSFLFWNVNCFERVKSTGRNTHIIQ